MLVCIDPGHGGRDPGAVGNGLREKDICLRLGLGLKDYLLNHYPVSVVMTRQSDVAMSLGVRATLANNRGADVFISLHINGHSNTSAQGYEDFIHTSRAARTVRLQNALHPHVASVWTNVGRANRGKKSANFAVLRQTSMPAILLENGFISNQRDAQLLSDSGFRAALVGAMGEGLAAAHGWRRKTKKGAPTLTDDIKGHWAEDALNWAKDNGLLTGYEDGTMRPDAPVTRAQLAVVLRRLREGG